MRGDHGHRHIQVVLSDMPDHLQTVAIRQTHVRQAKAEPPRLQRTARLGEIFPFEITLPDIFECRTIARLAHHIQVTGAADGARRYVTETELGEEVLLLTGDDPEPVDSTMAEALAEGMAIVDAAFSDPRTARMRDWWLAHRADGLTTSEIAAQWGVTRSNVKTTIGRADKKIRAAVAPRCSTR